MPLDPGEPNRRDRNRRRSLASGIIASLENLKGALGAITEGTISVPSGTPETYVSSLVSLGIGVRQIHLGIRRQTNGRDIYAAVFDLAKLIGSKSQDADLLMETVFETADGIRLNYRAKPSEAGDSGA